MLTKTLIYVLRRQRCCSVGKLLLAEMARLLPKLLEGGGGAAGRGGVEIH